MNKESPVMVEREVIPGNSDTRESIKVNDLVCDTAYLEALLRFRMDNSVAASIDQVDELIKQMKEAVSGVSVEGPISDSSLTD